LLLAVVLICTDPGYDPGIGSLFLPTVPVSYSIMSDTDPDADSISDASNNHSADDALISSAVRKLCDQLRANDPRISSTFETSNYISGCSEAEYIAVFQALKENTSLKHIAFEFGVLFERQYTERSALVTAEYVESSKTLQSLCLSYGYPQYSHEVSEMISIVLRALSRNTSVSELRSDIDVVTFASVAFEELLTRTQTLQKLQIDHYGNEVFSGVQIAAITSGFANNTTLRDLTFQGWREASLTPVLAALQGHPALQKIYFGAKFGYCLPSLSGLEALLRSQDSKVKELALERVDARTVGVHPVLQELRRNTTVIKLAVRKCVLSRENVQQLKAVLRQNKALQYLDLTSSILGSTGLAEIAPALYRNTSIKTLDLSSNGLHDIESASILRELIRRNKTITSLCIGSNAFGRNAPAARSILEGLRSNTALQQLDLTNCELEDHGMSLLANALAIRNASMLELNLHNNEITSLGVRALVDDNVEAVKTLTKVSLAFNSVESEGATILANALGRHAMPDLTQLNLMCCGIRDDGFVALGSALEQNTTLHILDFEYNNFGERGFMALAESLPNIKGLQEITIKANANFQSTLPLLMEGFRKNTSLVEVDIDEDCWCVPDDCLQEMNFLGYRNRFTPLLKASDSPGASPVLGIWSRALAKVTTEPDVLFHVLRNKPKLVGSAGGLKKRKRDGE
jgi:Ran GTPase-activating protein (RanGAP) involved in mRNA processing and transport